MHRPCGQGLQIPRAHDPVRRSLTSPPGHGRRTDDRKPGRVPGLCCVRRVGVRSRGEIVDRRTDRGRRAGAGPSRSRRCRNRARVRREPPPTQRAHRLPPLPRPIRRPARMELLHAEVTASAEPVIAEQAAPADENRIRGSRRIRRSRRRTGSGNGRGCAGGRRRPLPTIPRPWQTPKLLPRLTTNRAHAGRLRHAGRR